MSANRSDHLTLKVNATARDPIQYDRSITVMADSGQPSAATKAADKIMRSCRENVRFLNKHLGQYKEYLELPPLTENALYLAYTIRVRENPHFTAAEFRRYLTSCGIENRDRFSFQSETPVVARTQKTTVKSLSDNAHDTFCIACHQNLTILDMQSIARRIDSFFDSKLMESAGR